jgi:hyperosmotically inducible protein
MLKRLFVVICGVGVIVLTAATATAQAVETAKDKTASAATQAKEKTKEAVKATGTVLSDAEITTAVKTKLLADKDVGGMKIDVDTDHGVVTLTGPVTSATERAQALKLARQTKGVKKVVNKLSIEKK